MLHSLPAIHVKGRDITYHTEIFSDTRRYIYVRLNGVTLQKMTFFSGVSENLQSACTAWQRERSQSVPIVSRRGLTYQKTWIFTSVTLTATRLLAGRSRVRIPKTVRFFLSSKMPSPWGPPKFQFSGYEGFFAGFNLLWREVDRFPPSRA